MIPSANPFTAEEDETIRKMAQSGAFTIDCAARLGRSRNSIIGRAYRLGVSFRGGRHKNKFHAPRPAAFDRTGTAKPEPVAASEPVTKPNKRITWGRFWGSRHY